MELLLAVLLGVGLAAACGFRVFVPMLVLALAARSGHVGLASGMQWLAGDLALLVLVTATVLEITAYAVPWLDQLLDSVATPAAAVAGTLVTGAMITGMDPAMSWTLAAIVGGGAASLVQVSTVVTRAGSTLMTGGLGNPVVSTVEAGMAISLSLLVVLVPAGLLLALLAGGGVLWSRSRRRREATALPLPA